MEGTLCGTAQKHNKVQRKTIIELLLNTQTQSGNIVNRKGRLEYHLLCEVRESCLPVVKVLKVELLLNYYDNKTRFTIAVVAHSQSLYLLIHFNNLHQQRKWEQQPRADDYCGGGDSSGR